jgi:hypothetical protein
MMIDVEDNARDNLVILEFYCNAPSFVFILESIIEHTGDHGTFLKYLCMVKCNITCAQVLISYTRVLHLC